jgi:maltose/maltodextrin transport system substrate-binding protein
VVWFTVEGAKGMRRVGERFTAATGVPVVVETPDPADGPSKFQQASAAGKGPDIYIYAHDRIGEWVAAGILQSVNPGVRCADIDPLAWQGFTCAGGCGATRMRWRPSPCSTTRPW